MVALAFLSAYVTRFLLYNEEVSPIINCKPARGTHMAFVILGMTFAAAALVAFIVGCTFPRCGTRDMEFWNILAADPQELADFQRQLDLAQENLPKLSREELIEWHGAGPAPFPV